MDNVYVVGMVKVRGYIVDKPVIFLINKSYADSIQRLNPTYPRIKSTISDW